MSCREPADDRFEEVGAGGGSPFLQISRDAIVNMTVVTEITRVGDRRYELRLPDRACAVADASRTGAALLADYLRCGRPG
jgi:DNA-binding LytR/AlgR family response regulator